MLTLKHSLTLIVFSSFLITNAAIARTDTEAQTSFAKALAKKHEGEMDHSAHVNEDKSQAFHGIFYGYLPCTDCDGVKTTLSLKQNQNYLMVTQPARDSSREFYEKGKYEWNEETRVLTLTPRNKPDKHYYQIKDEGTIVQMSPDGTPVGKDLEDDYTLQNSDTAQTREVHIH